jgi:glycosyltransferase involved in cell wall biosynthesis
LLLSFKKEVLGPGILTMRIAIVHDWLYTIGGAERVLQGILRCFPGADLFCLFDFLPAADRERIGYASSKTSFMQRMPFVRRNHRLFLPLMPLAVEQLDLRGYDVVISSSYAVAKGVLTGPDQLHISYVHSPMRYAWDLQEDYLEESRMTRGVFGWLSRLLLHGIRIWDVRTAHGVDRYIANSRYVARRIKKLYGAEATVINPPVRVPDALTDVKKGDFFLSASRLVSYKNVRALIEAFAHLPEQQLIVVGDGPDFSTLRGLAGPNVRMLGFIDDVALADLMGRARALVFAAREDFGITPLEAQALGTPVIALGRGGARETVVSEGHAPTGLFFDTPTPEAIAWAVRRFIESERRYAPANCHAHARRFNEARFDREFTDFVHTRFTAFQAERDWRVQAPAKLAPAE